MTLDQIKLRFSAPGVRPVWMCPIIIPVMVFIRLTSFRLLPSDSHHSLCGKFRFDIINQQLDCDLYKQICLYSVSERTSAVNLFKTRWPWA